MVGDGGADLMTWFRVDDDLPFHRKVVAAGNAAMGLWVRAGAWCAQHLTDGFVPEDMVAILGTTSQRSKLINAGLWHEVPGGCQFHEWLGSGRQPTAESVREKRAKAAERQAKHRNAMYENSQASGGSHSVTDASVTGSVTPFVTPAPTRPDPTTSPGGDVVLAPAAPRDDRAGTQLSVIPGGQVQRQVPLTARDAVKAWHDAYTATHDAKPTERAVKQAGREAKALLDAGNPPDRVLATARSAGARGFATLEREYGHLASRGNTGSAAPRRESTTDARVRAGLELADKYGRQEDAG